MSLRTHIVAVFLVAWAGSAFADATADLYKAMGVKPADVITGTALSARVLPGEGKQLVGVVSYFTGRRDDARGVNVRLEVLRREGEGLISLYSRDLGEENGGNVGRGDLELLDLDSDGVNEIVVTYDNAQNALVQERRGEVLVYDGAGGFRLGWSGSMEYDATKAARDIPLERRDRFTRKLDIPNTLRARGRTLYMTKTMIAVAGERLAEPRVVQEAFPLRPVPEEP